MNAVDLSIPVIAPLLAGILTFSPRFARSSNWKAAVTPLASIKGSGFFVSAPFLAGITRPRGGSYGMVQQQIAPLRYAEIKAESAAVADHRY